MFISQENAQVIARKELTLQMEAVENAIQVAHNVQVQQLFVQNAKTNISTIISVFQHVQ